MMAHNPLISDSASETINKYVRQKIDSRLFVFRHYNPNSFRVLSLDAKFIIEALNYYKLMEDASLCKKFARNILKSNRRYKAYIKVIDDNYILANSLRTAIAHNQSHEDYNDDQLKKSKAWLLEKMGVANLDEITDVAQYESPLQELENNALQVIDAISSIVKLIENDSNKGNIVDKWIDQILGEYQSVNGEYRIKQLIKRYCESVKISIVTKWEDDASDTFEKNYNEIDAFFKSNDFSQMQSIFAILQKSINDARGKRRYLYGYIQFIKRYIELHGKNFSAQERIGLLPEEFAYKIVRYCLGNWTSFARLVVKHSGVR